MLLLGPIWNLRDHFFDDTYTHITNKNKQGKNLSLSLYWLPDFCVCSNHQKRRSHINKVYGWWYQNFYLFFKKKKRKSFMVGDTQIQKKMSYDGCRWVNKWTPHTHTHMLTIIILTNNWHGLNSLLRNRKKNHRN